MRNAPAIELADKIDYLHGSCGPGDEAVETHFARVFLAGERALKLHKPVRRDTMDYSTLAARQRDSEHEVRLNRRLAPDVYRRTVPLVVNASGRRALDEPGGIVDWLVEMRRLDRDRMLDAALVRGETGERALEHIVDLLTAFHASSEPEISDPAAFLRRLDAQTGANHACSKPSMPGARPCSAGINARSSLAGDPRSRHGSNAAA